MHTECETLIPTIHPLTSSSHLLPSKPPPVFVCQGLPPSALHHHSFPVPTPSLLYPALPTSPSLPASPPFSFLSVCSGLSAQSWSVLAFGEKHFSFPRHCWNVQRQTHTRGEEMRGEGKIALLKVFIDIIKSIFMFEQQGHWPLIFYLFKLLMYFLEFQKNRI